MFLTPNIKITLFLSCTILLLSGCDSKRGVDREAVREEMASRELKRLTKGEIMMRGEEIGRSLLAQTQQTFQQALMNAIQEKGITGAVEYCNLNAYELVKGFEDSLGIEIKRVTNKPRNPKDSLSGIEIEIFEAYEYSPENATAQLQELDEKTLIYNKPILINQRFCLNCHGKVGKELSEENYLTIKSHYPNDQAIGYEMGDLRGMWSIKIPKKVVVDKL